MDTSRKSSKMCGLRIVFGAVCLLMIHFTAAEDVDFTDCGSKLGSVGAVMITGCNKASRCNLKRNSNVTIEIKFTPTSACDELTAVVHGVVFDVPVPFPLPNPDGCKDSGITCPVKPGTEYTYLTTLPVQQNYPRVTVDVKWELKSGKDDYVCVMIPAKIN